MYMYLLKEWKVSLLVRFYDTIKNQFRASLKSIKIDSCNFFFSKTKKISFNFETIKPIINDFKYMTV